MKRTMLALLSWAAVLGTPSGATADVPFDARGGLGAHPAPRIERVRDRVFLGLGVGPLWYPGYYYPVPPPVVVTSPPPLYVQPSAPVYIEHSDSSLDGGRSGYWYYCRHPEGYYPYVKQCPDGWQRVLPQPPPA